MKLAFCMAILATPTIAFQCFQCNNGIDEDDTKPCIDQLIECPSGTSACSTMFYTTKQGALIHRRKFCTTLTTSIPFYFRLIRNTAICQTISTDQEYVQLTSLLQRQRREAFPPAPPKQYKNNLLCICTTSLCNGGTH